MELLIPHRFGASFTEPKKRRTFSPPKRKHSASAGGYVRGDGSDTGYVRERTPCLKTTNVREIYARHTGTEAGAPVYFTYRPVKVRRIVKVRRKRA